MKPLSTICLRAAFLVLLALGQLPQSTAADERPNILFIFSDDHAPHAIGAYNGWLKEVNPTPEIDKLAAQGMLFEKSFCTNSICGPSRASLFTGLLPSTSGIYGQVSDKNIKLASPATANRIGPSTIAARAMRAGFERAQSVS